MIKQYFFPVFFDVAAFALCAEVTFMFVILTVTGHAVHRQLFFKQVALVAAAAFCSQMLAK